MTLCVRGKRSLVNRIFWEEALDKISSVLVDGGVKQEFLDEILHIIARHDIYDWSQPENKSIELQVVQDADNLDAIWAIGIARTWKYSGAHNTPMWVPGENLEFNHDYEETGKNTSIIRHFMRNYWSSVNIWIPKLVEK